MGPQALMREQQIGAATAVMMSSEASRTKGTTAYLGVCQSEKAQKGHNKESLGRHGDDFLLCLELNRGGDALREQSFLYCAWRGLAISFFVTVGQSSQHKAPATPGASESL